MAANEAVAQIRNHSMLVAFPFNKKHSKNVKYSKCSPGTTHRAGLYTSRENTGCIQPTEEKHQSILDCLTRIPVKKKMHQINLELCFLVRKKRIF